jgi:hypothetical protein
MCKIVRISAVLAILVWLGSAQTAFGQTGSSGPAGRTAAGPGPIEHVGPVTPMPAGFGPLHSTSPGSLVTGPNNTEDRANEKIQAAATAAATAPGTVSLGNPSRVTTTPAPGTVTTRTPTSYYYTPGLLPGSQNGANRVAPGYAGTGEPGMKYTSVNPMGVTMPLGSWYSGLPVMPYRTSPTNAYSSMYTIPGYAATGQTYYTTNVWGTYRPRRRQGLPGGGIFGPRRDWLAYPDLHSSRSPGSYYYSAVPGAYYYGPAPVTNYYGAAPGSYYTYRTAPY